MQKFSTDRILFLSSAFAVSICNNGSQFEWLLKRDWAGTLYSINTAKKGGKTNKYK